MRNVKMLLLGCFLFLDAKTLLSMSKSDSETNDVRDKAYIADKNLEIEDKLGDCINEGKFDELKHLLKMYFNPKSSATYYWLGRMYSQMGNIILAKKYYNLAARYIAIADYNLGCIYIAEKDFQRALFHFLSAAQISHKGENCKLSEYLSNTYKENWKLLNVLGFLSFNKGEPMKAKEYFKAGARANKFWIYKNLAITYEWLSEDAENNNDREKAARHQNKADKFYAKAERAHINAGLSEF